MNTCHRLCVVLAVLLSGKAFAADSIQDRLASAKPGQTVELPAGEFSGGATLPAGVGLKGAGYGKTIIDAAGAEHGLLVSGGSGAVISDLTVRGAKGANVLVQDAAGTTVRRVRATGGLVGVNLKGARDARVENVVCDANRYGIIVSGGEGSVVVNCTVADNSSIGLSIPAGEKIAAFNNCVTGSSTAVYVGDEAHGAAVDHNLYTGMNVGKLGSQGPRDTLNNWKYLSGLDAHSVGIPVRYEDAAAGRFTVVNTLEWALDRPVVGKWGAGELAGKRAPAEDIDGKPRPADAPALGAFESSVSAPRPADGTLTIPSGDGVSSAGVFDSKGKLVAYLFQGLPLRKGEYSFWLPSRSYKGRAIEAGEYEVRLVESNLDWEYVGWIGNTDTSPDAGSSAPAGIEGLAFDNDGQLLVGRGQSESHDNLRAYDAASGKWKWTFKGNSRMRGVTMAADGLLYALRPENDKEARVSRFNTKTGDVAPWGKTDYGQFMVKGGGIYSGIAALGAKLYYTDPPSDAVRVATTQSPEPTTSIKIKSPSNPAADAKSNTVWVISGGEKLVAISADGKVVAESAAVPAPMALAARDGRLAVASKQTGKVHLFDASDPANLKSLSTLGRGDGPDGRILPDRFLFQDGAMPVALAFGPRQELAVGERESRLQVFDAAGKLTWSALSTGGGAIMASKVTPGAFFAGGYSLMLDSETNSWRPESFHRALSGGTEMVGDLEVQGQTFIAFNGYGYHALTFAKFSPDKCEPANGMLWPHGTNEPWSVRADSNGDRRIDPTDAVVATLNDEKGQPVAGRVLFDRYNETWPNGDVTSANADGWLTRWPCAGLDKNGNPIFRFADRVPVPYTKCDLVSPYDHKPIPPGGRPGTTDHQPRPGGGWVLNSGCSGNPARSMLNNGGVDVIAIDKDGVVDWVVPFGASPRVGSLKAGDGLYVAGMGQSYDFFVLNDDGLMVEGFSFPKQAHYVGHWVDHTDALNLFVDKSGRLNVLLCDYMTNRNHWMRLAKKQIHESKAKLTVGKETATRLAALPVQLPDMTAGKPATPTVRVAKLSAPLQIDGELQKWRDAGVQPIIFAPESAAGIDGPRDCSAIVRLAYHGQDLYVQAIRFDDLVSAHQPLSRFYLQDAFEMAVNGTLEGIKHNLSMTTDVGPVNLVDGWDLKGHVLDRNDSPIVIKTLEDASSVSERQLIEGIYGVDMSKCQVQVFETRIPMNDKTYAGRTQAMFELKPGARCWLGFLIDDNDQPGTDLQNVIWWPVTYGTTNPKEAGAIAVFD